MFEEKCTCSKFGWKNSKVDSSVSANRSLQSMRFHKILNLENFRFYAFISVLILGFFFIHPATAVSSQYICGDGVLDPGEACDNGPENSDVAPNACRTDCRLPHCGDGVVDSGEQCDDGRNSDSSPNTCRTDCTLPVCGDGVVDDGSHGSDVFNEACDDGNQDNSDGCMVDCKSCLQLGLAGNIEITADTDLCPAEYRMDDYGDYGAIIIKATGVTLDCHGATLIGEGRGVGIVNFRSNDVTIRNCRIRGYGIGLQIQDARNVFLEGNYICGNRQRDVKLIDSTDVHGYKPSMAVTTACLDKQIRQPGRVPASVMTSQAQSTTRQTHGTVIGGVAASKSLHKNIPNASSSVLAVRSVQSKKQGTVEANKSLSFYEDARNARWTSKSGKLVFGSDRIPNMGMVKTLPRARLANGNRAVRILLTQPDWKQNGYIQGEFPVRNLGRRSHFKTTVAIMKGADPTGLVSFDILVREGRHTKVLKQQRLRGKQQIPLYADLTPWKGKNVRIILRVRHLKGAKQVPAVWVNPILSTKK